MTMVSRRLSAQALSVLAALAESGGSWRYGLEIATKTGLKSGSLYPILIRLSERGLLDSRWLAPERPGRPARHAYRITPGGHAALRQGLRTSSDSALKEALS